MFTRVVRYSGNDKAFDEGAKLYHQAKTMWGGQPGFHSMQRYRITDGPHANQQMVVLRFNNKSEMDKAREAVGSQHTDRLKKLEEAGVKTEETYMLEEIV